VIARLLLAFGAVADAAALQPHVEADGSIRVEVVGLAPVPGPSAFAIRVADGSPGLPPVAGTWTVEGKTARFRPRFPLEPGLRHRVSVADASTDLTIPDGERAVRPSTRVTRAEPTAAVLPENLLKFYLHFTAPMARGRAYRHVAILDASGQPLALPFLEIGEELWDPTGTRLTLLLDPGRIKRGLRPRDEDGPILETGRSYTLVVAPAWPDASGRPLASSFRKAFRAGPADAKPPDPAAWTIAPPRVGTVETLNITSPEPLDAAIWSRALAIAGPDGRPVLGSASIEADGTRWRFVPAAPWSPGRHAIAISSDLEDLAGNAVGRPFEVDSTRPDDGPAQPSALTFDVR